MATINVLDAAGSTVAVARAADTGRAAASASLPTVLSTEDKTALDAAVTDLAAIEVLQTAGNALLSTIDADTGAMATDLAAIEVLLTTQNGYLDGLETLIGATNAQLPATLGSKSVANSLATSVKSGGNEYETVAASQTTQTLGATGATGDYLEGLTCVVSTAATSQVQIKDGSDTAITVLPNSVGAGVGSYYIPLGLTSRTGAWQITTAAGVAVIATGDFT